jgi:hypothetical protein
MNVNNHIKDGILLQNISSNVGVVIYDSQNRDYTEIEGSIKDKMNIAVQSSLNNPISLVREDGTPVKIKNYLSKVVKTNAGRDIVVIKPSADSEIHLDRNLPLYSAQSNVSGNNRDAIYDTSKITRENFNISVDSVATSNIGRTTTIHDHENDIKLRRMTNFGTFENASSMPVIDTHQIPILKPSRKIKN